MEKNYSLEHSSSLSLLDFTRSKTQTAKRDDKHWKQTLKLFTSLDKLCVCLCLSSGFVFFAYKISELSELQCFTLL